MSGPHRIGLQAAWHVEAGAGAWIRSFGRPTGIDPGDRVWLVIERPAACVARLNGRPLPTIAAGVAAWRHDVTADLQHRNELRLDVPGAASASLCRVPLPESLGTVALEIEPSA